MRTKRILSMILCLAIICLSLVSCDDEIGAWLDKYGWQEEVIEKVEFDLYIIVGEGTDEVAKITVNDKINQYLEDKYNTVLNIQYIPESQYADYIASLSTSEASPVHSDEKQYGGKIVLINGLATYNTVSGLLSDLSGYIDAKEFASLNTQITETVIDAARDNDKLLVIPNEHVIGEYKYLIINREIAEYQLHYSAQTELLEMTTLEDAAELITDAAAIGKTQDEVVKIVTGQYEDKAEWEAAGWICNVSEYPEAEKELVLKSAFGVIASPNEYEPADVNQNGTIEEGEKVLTLDYAYRAMQIIYSINADETLRNLLQYGVENTNYQIKNGIVVPLTGEGSEYNMNVIYTGDVFKAYFCEGVWTAEMKANGEAQNKELVLPE